MKEIVKNKEAKKSIQKIKLSEMLDMINESNIHKEFDWGKPTEKEFWDFSKKDLT